MPTFSLGDVTASTRAFQFLKDSYEREKLPPGETTTAMQVRDWSREDYRRQLALRVTREKRLQREEAAEAEDAALDGEVTVA